MLRRCLALVAVIVAAVLSVAGASTAAKVVSKFRLVREFGRGTIKWPAVGVSGDSRFVAILNNDVSVWDARSGRKLVTIAPYDVHNSGAGDFVRLSYSGRYLAFTHDVDLRHTTFEVWDVRRHRRTLNMDEGLGVKSVFFSKDERRMAYFADDRVYVRSTMSGRLVFSAKVGWNNVGALSDSGRRLAYVDGDGAELVDVDSGRRLGTVANVGLYEVWFEGERRLGLFTKTYDARTDSAWIKVVWMDVESGRVQWVHIPGDSGVKRFSHHDEDGEGRFGGGTLAVEARLDEPRDADGPTTISYWDYRTGTLLRKSPDTVPLGFFSDSGEVMVYCDEHCVRWYRCRVEDVDDARRH